MQATENDDGTLWIGQDLVKVRRDVNHSEVMEVHSKVPKAQTVEFIQKAAHATTKFEMKARLFQVADAFTEPKPQVCQLEPSTYGQGNPAQT